MPETTLLIKAALNLRVGAGFDVYVHVFKTRIESLRYMEKGDTESG